MRRFYKPILLERGRKYSEETGYTNLERLDEISNSSKSLRSFKFFLSSNGSIRPNKPSDDIIKIVRHISSSLAERNIDVVIGGSIAASMLAIQPRMTENININIRNSKNSDTLLSENDLRSALYQMKKTNVKRFRYGGIISPGQRIITTRFRCMRWPVEAFIYTRPQDQERMKLFSDFREIEGLKFAPLECICLWKMLCSGDKLPQAKKDIASILRSKSLNTEWIETQLRSHNGDLVDEWLKVKECP